MRPAGRAVTAVFFVALGLASTARVIDRLVPEDIDDFITAKMKVFERRKDDYTAVFIGDSRVYREVVPERFDQTLGAAGAPSLSFNLAAPGMCLFEAHHLLSRLAGLRPKKLRYVFLGAHTLPDLADVDANTRTVYWRAWEETALETASLAGAAGLDWRTRLRLLYNAWRLFIFRGLNRGRLPNFLANAGAWRETARSLDMEKRRGYYPLELDDFYVYVRYREQYVRDGPDGFAARLDAWKRRGPDGPDLSWPQRRGYEAIRELARAQGWKLIFIGEISYALYLIHQHIGFVIIDRLSRWGIEIDAAVVIAMGVSILLAWAITRFVEKPAQRTIRAAFARDRDPAARVVP